MPDFFSDALCRFQLDIFEKNKTAQQRHQTRLEVTVLQEALFK